MEPTMTNKNKGALFIPYRRSAGGYEYYLQKRDMNPKANPGAFSLFGGSFENDEDMNAALSREVMEELTYEPRRPVYFTHFETPKSLFDIFIEEVGADFETLVDVREGEYGKFLKLSDIKNSPTASLLAQYIVDHLERKLNE
jgi:8-oxo-dGTP pyrophosphatase MutT (NUDIX family)